MRHTYRRSDRQPTAAQNARANDPAIKARIEEFARLGIGVDITRIDDPKEPSFEIIEAAFPPPRQVTRPVEVSHRTVVEALGKDFFAKFRPDQVPEGVKQTDAKRAFARERTERLKKWLPTAILTKGKVWVGFNVASLQLFVADAFRSIVEPASALRMNPIPGKTYRLAVVWRYWTDRRTSLRLRRGLALFMSPQTLSAAEYTPPSSKPAEAEVTFVPVDRYDRRSMKQVVEGVCLHPANPYKRMILDAGFDPVFGQPVKVALIEGESLVMCVPVGTPPEEATTALARREELKLEPDEFEWEGQAHNVWDALAEFRVTIETDHKEFKTISRRIRSAYHPDFNATFRNMRRVGVEPTPESVASLQATFNRYDAAFRRAQELISEFRGEQATEHVEDDAPAEGESETLGRSPTGEPTGEAK